MNTKRQCVIWSFFSVVPWKVKGFQLPKALKYLQSQRQFVWNWCPRNNPLISKGALWTQNCQPILEQWQVFSLSEDNSARKYLSPVDAMGDIDSGVKFRQFMRSMGTVSYHWQLPLWTGRLGTLTVYPHRSYNESRFVMHRCALPRPFTTCLQ